MKWACLILALMAFSSCSSTEAPTGEPQPGRLIVDSIQAGITVTSYSRCNGPCAVCDLVVKYRFQEFRGSIDNVWFRPLEGHMAYGVFIDYVGPVDPGEYYIRDFGHYLPGETFEGLDTVHVQVTIRGAFWNVRWNTHYAHYAHYGDFSYVDTLTVAVRRDD